MINGMDGLARMLLNKEFENPICYSQQIPGTDIEKLVDKVCNDVTQYVKNEKGKSLKDDQEYIVSFEIRRKGAGVPPYPELSIQGN